jgi:uncharacterized protein YbjT (DUF2867 family)
MIAVAGATGKLGSQVCLELLERGSAVRALVRDPSSPAARALAKAGADLVRADLERGCLQVAVAGAACVVSTATSFPVDPRPGAIDAVDRDGNLALVDASAAAAVPRFVFVSFRPIPLAFPLQDAKRAVEERLAAAPLDAVVLRPGKFMDVWLSPLCGFDPAAATATVFGDGTSAVTWISARDVAELAARSALGEGPASGIVELGGPEALTQREVIAIYERVCGRPFALRTEDPRALERTLAGGGHPVETSLAALMLEAHLGAVTDVTGVRAAMPIELETVERFARRTAPAA